MNKEEILNTFLLANIPEIITQEEFDDVKKAIKDLQQENKELKEKYGNAVADYEKTMFEKEQLKKQLESVNKQISYLRRSIERKEERIIDLQYERIPYTNEYVDKLLNQQKEFISYLEKKEKEFDILGDPKNAGACKGILQKYKEIIGVSDENTIK